MTNSKHTKRALISSVIALILCCSMLVGTTFAWFTDEVTSVNNVITAGNLDIQVTNEDGDIQGQSKLFQDVKLWEPGVVAYENLTVENIGTLALQYDLKISFADQNIINETGKGLADVLKVAVFEKAITETDREALTSKTGAEWTLLKDFSFQETLLAGESDVYGVAIWWEPSDKDNDWNLNNGKTTDDGADYLHIDLGVNVFATQVPHETDSFDQWYDLNAAMPEAVVNVLGQQTVAATWGMGGSDVVGGLPLNCSFQFLPTQTQEEALASGYGYWHADFVVTVDRDVAEGQAAVAGYYSAFCDDYNDTKWVALTADLPANTPIRLVESMGGGSISVNYNELCYYSFLDTNTEDGFLCGAWADESLNGMTLTVELRLYETEGDPLDPNGPKNIETGKYVTVATYTHTFSQTVADNNGLKEAFSNGLTNVTLADGNYTLPAVSNSDVTITGTEDTVITVNKPAFHGSDVTLNGVTVKGSGYATGIQHVNTVTYNDATIVGEMCLYGEKVVFNNCTFELNGQYIWTYGAKEVEFNNCTFNTTGKAILVYNEGAGASKVTVKGCTFNATAGAKAGAIANQNCAAIEIDNFQSNGTGAAHVVIAEGNTFDSNFSGEWRIKNYVAGNAITVNGTEYTQIAVDGKLMTIDADKNVTVN